MHAPVHWLVYSEQAEEIIASGVLPSALELASLQDRADSAEVIALAPSSDVLLTHVNLPGNASRKALGAIPFMLEEDICGDISKHFFALGERDGDLQQVAVVAIEKLKLWQQVFKDAGIFCQTMVPDALALPYKDNTLSLVQLESTIIARTERWQGLAGESDWLLNIVTQMAITDEKSIVCYSDVDGLDDSNSEHISSDYTDLPLLMMLKNINTKSLNLFQDRFAVKREGNPHWQKWKIAAALAVIALTVNIVAKTIELNDIKSQRQQINQQVSATIAEGFPDIGEYRSARQAVEREMRRLEQAGGSIGMLAILSQLSDAFASSGVSPQTLRYDSSRTELRMQSVADNFESLERFRRDVQSLGFAVDQGAINNQGDQVVGVIVVKG
jgi:general secretion pathway protein L